MTTVYEDECEFAGVDPKRVANIARRLGRAAADARELGLFVFGGTGNGTLRWLGDGTGNLNQGALVVAEIKGGSWDGGDGSTHHDESGLLRGEDG